MPDAKDLLRMLESLALMMQDSAEAGDLDVRVYADVAELIGYVTAVAKNMIGGDAA